MSTCIKMFQAFESSQESLATSDAVYQHLFSSSSTPSSSNFTHNTTVEAKSIKYVTKAHLHVAFVCLLALINIIVILGNVLVILAVAATSRLRSVTNIFIVSLAIADLLLGSLVMPSAVLFEVSLLT